MSNEEIEEFEKHFVMSKYRLMKQILNGRQWSGIFFVLASLSFFSPVMFSSYSISYILVVISLGLGFSFISLMLGANVERYRNRYYDLYMKPNNRRHHK